MGNLTPDDLKVITGKRMRASPPAKKGARARPAARAARVAKPRKAKGKR